MKTLFENRTPFREFELKVFGIRKNLNLKISNQFFSSKALKEILTQLRGFVNKQESWFKKSKELNTKCEFFLIFLKEANIRRTRSKNERIPLLKELLNDKKLIVWKFKKISLPIHVLRKQSINLLLIKEILKVSLLVERILFKKRILLKIEKQYKKVNPIRSEIRNLIILDWVFLKIKLSKIKSFLKNPDKNTRPIRLKFLKEKAKTR